MVTPIAKFPLESDLSDYEETYTWDGDNLVQIQTTAKGKIRTVTYEYTDAVLVKKTVVITDVQ
jgi:hypothetical protein